MPMNMSNGKIIVMCCEGRKCLHELRGQLSVVQEVFNCPGLSKHSETQECQQILKIFQPYLFSHI